MAQLPLNGTARKNIAAKVLILARPDGFEPPTTWFEVAQMIL
jgi:hypothetical protein